MVRFNFWDKFFGNKPKSFKKSAEKQIKQNTLYYMQDYGRGRWIKTEEIFEKTLEKTDLFNSNEGKMLFAIQGVKAKIHSATHNLRKDGYPIISGIGAKGYRYADEKCKDFIYIWDEKISAWEKRKSELIKEKENDRIIIEKLIEKLKQKKRFVEAKQLQEVLVRYNKKKVENET